MRTVKRVVRYVVIVVAWVFVTVAGSLGAAVAYEPLRSFGPTLYVIVGALLLAALALWRLWRAAPRIALFATAVVVLGGTALVTATSTSPAGKYAIGGCRGGYEYTEDEYYELSGGVLYDVIAGRRHRMGSYYKKNGQWVLQIDRRDGELDEQKLRFSLLGFDTLLPPIEGEQNRPTTFERRRLIPFTRPRWIPEWLE
jgi:hypothetical protein